MRLCSVFLFANINYIFLCTFILCNITKYEEKFENRENIYIYILCIYTHMYPFSVLLINIDLILSWCRVTFIVLFSLFFFFFILFLLFYFLYFLFFSFFLFSLYLSFLFIDTSIFTCWYVIDVSNQLLHLHRRSKKK